MHLEGLVLFCIDGLVLYTGFFSEVHIYNVMHVLRSHLASSIQQKPIAWVLVWDQLGWYHMGLGEKTASPTEKIGLKVMINWRLLV